MTWWLRRGAKGDDVGPVVTRRELPTEYKVGGHPDPGRGSISG